MAALPDDAWYVVTLALCESTTRRLASVDVTVRTRARLLARTATLARVPPRVHGLRSPAPRSRVGGDHGARAPARAGSNNV